MKIIVGIKHVGKHSNAENHKCGIFTRNLIYQVCGIGNAWKMEITEMRCCKLKIARNMNEIWTKYENGNKITHLPTPCIKNC